MVSLRLSLSGDLLDLDNDEFSRLYRRESDDDIEDAAIDVVCSRRRLVALHDVVVERALASEIPRKLFTLKRNCDHSVSSLGSKTANLVPR